MLSVCSLIGVICWILKIYLTPLKNIPEQILEIKTKIKGEGELDRMIRIRIQEHELNCTYRNGCKQASK
jgi:hypothetical protein